MSGDLGRQAARDAAFRAMYMIALMMSIGGVCIFFDWGDFATYIGFADTTMHRIFGGVLIVVAAVELFVIIPFLKTDGAGKENRQKKQDDGS